MSAHKRTSRFGSPQRARALLLATFGAWAVLLAIGLLMTSDARAAKTVESVIGGQAGTAGGVFGGDGPGDLAVRQSTGHLYVIDSRNLRVQRFDAAGNFELAFGRDVVEAGAPNDLGLTAFERCSIADGNVASDCKEGIAGTTPNDHPGGELANISQIAVDQATGNVFVVASARMSVFDADGNWLRTSGWGVVPPGGTGQVAGNEQQTVSLHPRITGGTFKLAFSGSQTSALPADATGAQVQSALEGLPAIGVGDVLASGPAGGPWTVDFGGAFSDVNVAQLQPVEMKLVPEDVLAQLPDVAVFTVIDGNRYEICTVAAQCKQATGSSGAGAVGPTIAVGPAGVFVGGSKRVNQYETDGTFVRAFGVGVDTGQQQFEVCTTATVCQEGVRVPSIYNAPDPFPSNGQFANDPHLAVDGSGVVYAAASVTGFGSANLVMRFDSTKSAPADILLPDPIAPWKEFSAGEYAPCGYCTLGPLPIFPATGLEIDAETGNLLYGVSAQLAVPLQDSTQVLELDTSTHPATVVDRHLPSASPNWISAGPAVDGAREKIYVSTTDPEVCKCVLVLGDNSSPPPVATIEPATDVEDDGTATLHGEIIPNGPPGIKTRYRFEYAKDGGEWIEVPVPDAVAGEGSTPVPVSAAISGLEANTLYRIRLVARLPLGLGTATTGETSFKSAALPPVVTTTSPSRVKPTSAVLTGRINANNSPTDYWFEWGESTAYGNRIPIPDGEIEGGKPRSVLTELAGLQPETTYHYRLVADNGVEVSPGVTEVAGADLAFATRSVVPGVEVKDCAVGPDGPRCFEMVTPPFKSVRAGTGFTGRVRNNPNPGVPSLSGDTVAWQIPFFPLTDEVGWPANNDRRIIRRTEAGWVNETYNTLPLMSGLSILLRMNPLATSGDMETVPFANGSGGSATPDTGALLPTEGGWANRHYTFRKGTGIQGVTPWLTNPEEQAIDLGSLKDHEIESERALLNDDGSAMARWGWYGGLAENPETPTSEDPSDDQKLQGRMLYLQRAADPLQMPSAPKELVNECTGSGASATQIPERDANGTALNQADDVIDAQACAKGKLVQPRGAVAGGGSQNGGPPMGGRAATALSNDGNRVFFQSPDPETGPVGCGTGIGAATNCPPQLFVRQHDDEGNATVRWISRSRSVPGPDNSFSGTMIAGQQIALMGAGSGFEGASRDGRFVYFKTNAPLTPDDPNGQGSQTPGGVKTGAASDASWDLYRYELPADRSLDPAGGTLTRISGGPDGTADPNTNPFGKGLGGAARFISDDGQRAYFLTGAPIPGADATPPAGGSTAPGAATSAQSGTTRNLYLFDGNETGADRYRFVARIPFSASAAEGNPVALDACAGSDATIGPPLGIGTEGKHVNLTASNCFRGTPDGSHVVFQTGGQLSGDDADDAGDVYLYDAEADELVRISAPPPGVGPYVCNGKVFEPVQAGGGCNGDLGFGPSSGLSGPAPGPPDTARGFGGMRYHGLSENPDGTVSAYFESRSELVPEDTNGDYWDTYEWRGGELTLISLGNIEHDSWFSGNSVDGRDVFIWTSARIDPRELDAEDFDIYDARRGSIGFPYTPPPEPCDVLAFKCEGQAIPAPPSGSPASAGFQGTGNVAGKPKPRCAKGKVRRKGRCVPRKRAAANRKRAGANRRGGRR